MRRQTLLLWLTSTFVLLLTLLLLVGVNMRRGLNHDEYQFVASGYLIAKAGLLPYRDFPYFHVPGLSLLYAALFQVTAHLLLAARLVSVGGGWLLALMLWALTLVELRHATVGVRLTAAVGVLLLLIAAPMFIYTSGRAWNHDLPMVLMMGALWLFDRVWGAERPGVANPRLPAQTGSSRLGLAGAGWQPALMGCGLLLGLATAIRLSFAFALLALGLAILAMPKRSWQWRRWALLNFACGGVVGALPALWFLGQSPAVFLFGNLTYIGLNTQYYHSLVPPPLSMTLVGKLTFLGQLLRSQPANALPFLALLVTGGWAWRAQTVVVSWRRLQPVMLLFVGMLVSGLVATPSQTQYFYPLWPLTIFAIVLLVGGMSQQGSGAGVGNAWSMRWPALLLLSAGVLAAGLSRSPYQDGLEIVFSPREWYPNKLHARGQWVRTLVEAGDGPAKTVLTVAPIIPAEGGVAIYPELATGPFAWRVAPLLSATDRQRYQLFTPDELIAQLAVTAPRALLVGLENDDVALETPLVTWAQRQGYVPLALPDEGTLWVSPLAEWGGAIRLGAHTVPLVMQPGTSADVVFYLQNIQPLSTNLNRLVRLVGADGQEYWRAEGWPWGAATSNWQPGDVWPDGQPLAVPAQAPVGCYRVELSFYDPETFDPLGETVTVGHVWVGASLQTDGQCGGGR